MLRRPAAVQVAALCVREGSHGHEILLVTSSNKNWILPKGWPIEGKTAAEAALQEAWEEAGVREGKADPESIGTFPCHKTGPGGHLVPVQTHVFRVAVKALSDKYPEKKARKRRWVSLGVARTMVTDPGLLTFLKRLSL